MHSPLSAERLISHSSIISKMLNSSLRRGPSRKQTPLNSKRPRSLSLCNELPPLFPPSEKTKRADSKALTETNTHSKTCTHTRTHELTTHIQGLPHKHPQQKQTGTLSSLTTAWTNTHLHTNIHIIDRYAKNKACMQNIHFYNTGDTDSHTH